MIALLVLELLLGTSPDRAAKAPNVTVDFSAVDRELLGDTALHVAYKSLLARLVDDGFVMTEPNQAGAIVVTVRRTSEQNLSLQVESAAGIRSRKLRFGESAGEQEEFQLVQATIELVRGARDDLSAMAPSPPAFSASTRAVGAELGGAMMWSGSSTGVMENLDAAVRLGPLRLTVGLVGHEPLGLPSDLHIFEWGALAGARLGTHALAPWLALQMALGGGFLQERYSGSDVGGVESRGAVNEALGTGSLGVALEIATGLCLGLDAGAWLTPHGHTYLTASGAQWKAPRLRPFAGLRLEYLR
jgi:hypothetical protein